MKPPRFDYFDPTSVGEVLALLQQYGDEAKLLAGGQSLIPVLNMRLTRPTVLIDLNRVAELDLIREEAGVLTIGAMTRHATVQRSPLVVRSQPLLCEALHHVGHVQIRNRGTIGGSLAHADPAAELPAVMLALEAQCCIAGTMGARTVPVEDFFLMYFTTCLQSDELLTAIRIPTLPPRTGYAFEEIARRHGDFALVGVACTLTLSKEGAISDARLALTGVGPAPVRARAAEALLIGQTPQSLRCEEVTAAVQGVIMPDSDVHASAEYRQHLAGVLTERAIERALLRVCAEGGERR